MKRFFTADPHFGHERMRKVYQPDRSILWPDIHKHVNGTKNLVLGNHDKEEWRDYIKAGFASVQRYKFINIKGIGPVGLAHDPSNCIADPTIPWLVGHLHSQFLRMGNAINVGVDVRAFAPISEEELAEDFRRTKIHMKVDPNIKEIIGER
jgi:calcineurin-like phosphoesterase family protein